MDAFFAAVEMRDCPELRAVPMAVGGSSDRRGVISTANYEARKFGVKSAMASAYAQKLCPNLVLVRGNMQKYREVSEQIFQIFHEYTHLIEGVSLDEAYLDVTDCPYFKNSATLIAQEIRKKIFERTGGLTASAGIAPNKLLAKLASDHNKPNGQFTISPNQVQAFIAQVPIQRIPGVGKVTAEIMDELGIRTCQDLSLYRQEDLISRFGKFGATLFNYCRGIDERQVESEYERKSLGTEETFAKDISDLEEMKLHIRRLSEELSKSLDEFQERKIKNLQVKIKYFDFKVTTIERSMPFSVDNYAYLLEERWSESPRPIRLLGVGVKFSDWPQINQLRLFDVPDGPG